MKPGTMPPDAIAPGSIKPDTMTPGCGILNIRAMQTSQEGVLIEFADTGPGIHTDVIRKLFTPFYTTKEKGMGLGLSIAYRIVEEHKGKIEVISAPGEGSNFRVYLPA
jgi:signal transduction histidine kinase